MHDAERLGPFVDPNGLNHIITIVPITTSHPFAFGSAASPFGLLPVVNTPASATAFTLGAGSVWLAAHLLAPAAAAGSFSGFSDFGRHADRKRNSVTLQGGTYVVPTGATLTLTATLAAARRRHRLARRRPHERRTIPLPRRSRSSLPRRPRPSRRSAECEPRASMARACRADLEQSRAASWLTDLSRSSWCPCTSSVSTFAFTTVAFDTVRAVGQRAVIARRAGLCRSPSPLSGRSAKPRAPARCWSGSVPAGPVAGTPATGQGRGRRLADRDRSRKPCSWWSAARAAAGQADAYTLWPGLPPAQAPGLDRLDQPRRLHRELSRHPGPRNLDRQRPGCRLSRPAARGRWRAVPDRRHRIAGSRGRCRRRHSTAHDPCHHNTADRSLADSARERADRGACAAAFLRHRARSGDRVHTQLASATVTLILATT